MKLSQLLIAGGLAATLVLPLAASAQQAPQAPAGSAQQAAQPNQPAVRPGMLTPSADKLQRRYTRMLEKLNVTGDQQTQINSMINAFAQDHPAGSPIDRKAAKDLRMQIMSVLTASQQTQLEQEQAALRAQRLAQRQARLQQQQQSAQQQPQQPPAQQQQPQQQPQQPPQQPAGQPPA